MRSRSAGRTPVSSLRLRLAKASDPRARAARATAPRPVGGWATNLLPGASGRRSTGNAAAEPTRDWLTQRDLAAVPRRWRFDADRAS